MYLSCGDSAPTVSMLFVESTLGFQRQRYGHCLSQQYAGRVSHELLSRYRSPESLCSAVVKYRGAECEGLRFDSSWGIRIFSLSHARDKTKNIFLYIFTELKTYHLSYSINVRFVYIWQEKANRVGAWVGEKITKDMSRLSLLDAPQISYKEATRKSFKPLPLIKLAQKREKYNL